MSDRHQPPDSARELDVRPADALVHGVRGSQEDQRPWLADSPVVPALGALGIAHAGVMAARIPYQIVRTNLSGAYFMATFSGEGEVYLDGRWTRCRPGGAVLLIPGVLHAFRSVGDQVWKHCWVRVASGANILRGPADRMQLVTSWEPEPLRHAVLGLRAEALHGGSPVLLQLWSELLLACVQAFSSDHAPDPRIVRLWETVAGSLSAPWSILEMASVANLSPEHMRRLSRRATGRSPHAHLMNLRMKKAVELLQGTDWTIERIAESVGYASPFAFSSAFKQVMGWPPSSFARRQGDEG